VSINGDTHAENFETFKAVISNPSNAVLASPGASNTGIVTLENDDLPLLSSIGTIVSVDETAGVANVRFKLNYPYYQNITVNVSTANGSAIAPGDYSPVSTSITFLKGTKGPITVPVTVNTDGVTEPLETFTVVGDPVPAGMANRTVTVKIKANNS
jgi:hypothetical protein